MPANPPSVLFDLDGTLIDTMPAMVAGFNAVLGDRIGRAIDAPEVAARLGPRLAEIFDQYLPGQGSELASEYERAYAGLAGLAVPFPGVVDAVARLRAAGIPMAVVTSKRTAASIAALDAADLLESMAFVVAEEDVTALKPSPAPILQALARLGAEPEHTWMIGDSQVDLDSARASGVRFAAALWGYFPEVFAGEPVKMLDDPGRIPAAVLGQR